MIKPIVRFLLKRRAKELDRQPAMVRGDLIMNAAVIGVYQPTEDFVHIRRYVDDLQKRGLKRVHFYIYFQHKKEFEAFEARTNEFPFDNRAFNWIGKYKSSDLSQRVGTQYDVVMDLTRGRSFACDVVLAKMTASWKAGECDANREHLLDFMIDVKGDRDIRKLIHHLDHYLTNFNKSNVA